MAINLGPGTYWKTWPGAGLVIVGQAENSPYEEDMKTVQSGRAHGYIFGRWFSEACPEGELGTNHHSYCWQITEKEFKESLSNIPGKKL